MKKGIFLLVIIVLASIQSGSAPGAGRSVSLRPAAGPNDPPIYFIANRGQTAAEVLFYAQTPGATLWLTQHSLVCGPARMVFKNAKPDVAVAAIDPADYRVSYFEGKNEAAWHTDIPTSKTVLYRGLYDGIDLKVYGRGGEIEYDWIVRPGSDPSLIRFAFENARRTRLSRDGDLVVETEAGRYRHRKPSGHQIIEGTTVNVGAAFREVGNGEFGVTAAGYDRSRDLVIDPVVLVYSTYLGGSDRDIPSAITVDATGAAYVGTFTKSKNFPPENANKSRSDVVITKIAPDGTDLVYSAFFPGGTGCGGEDIRISVDGQGSAYAVGTTTSQKFPIKNAFQASYQGGSSDAFFLKLAPNGQGLVFSSYLGGGGDDYGVSIAEDSQGMITVAGHTNSRDFPAKNAFQAKRRAAQDCFVARFRPNGRSLVYSTYLGSSDWDYTYGLAVDKSGAAYIAGLTYGLDFPRREAFQQGFGGGYYDAFITKLAPAGNELIYSSYLGGSGSEDCYGIAVDADGAAYITGATAGTFPVYKAFQKARNGSKDGFVSKVSADGKSLVYSTYLGGSGSDLAYAIAVDGNGAAYVAGVTYSRDFPVKNPYQRGLKGQHDAFLTVLDPQGQSLLYSTFLGGIYHERASAVAVDSQGGVYLAGYTNSLDFPLAKAYQKKYGGGTYDGFALKLLMNDH